MGEESEQLVNRFGTGEKLEKLLSAAKEWHGFNSNDNGHRLYNAASAYFGSEFNPFDYDDVP